MINVLSSIILRIFLTSNYILIIQCFLIGNHWSIMFNEMISVYNYLIYKYADSKILDKISFSLFILQNNHLIFFQILGCIFDTTPKIFMQHYDDKYSQNKYTYWKWCKVQLFRGGGGEGGKGEQCTLYECSPRLLARANAWTNLQCDQKTLCRIVQHFIRRKVIHVCLVPNLYKNIGFYYYS